LLPDATVVRSILTGAGVRDPHAEETSLGLVCRVPSDVAPQVLAALRASELDFRVLADMLGADTGEDIEITYHLRSLSRDEEMYVKTSVPYDGQLCSVWNTYPSALLQERETAELLGLTLDGHPNPKRLFTTEGVEPLLRKSIPHRGVEEVRER
jgi:NADH:ubiquinone oxidoreductase subunit C